MFPANNSRTYQDCQNNSGITSVPELLIRSILGRTRIVRELFTCRLNGAVGHIFCRNVSSSSGRNQLAAKLKVLETYCVIKQAIVKLFMDNSGASQNCSNDSGRECVPELLSRTILVRTGIAQFWKVLELLHVINNSGTYQNWGRKYNMTEDVSQDSSLQGSWL